jgi:hypothetical protein
MLFYAFTKNVVMVEETITTAIKRYLAGLPGFGMRQLQIIVSNRYPAVKRNVRPTRAA